MFKIFRVSIENFEFESSQTVDLSLSLSPLSPPFPPPCARREEERGERERGERKREVNGLTRFKLKIFNWNSKKFEYKSCSKFKFLQLSFQAKLRFSNDLKVKNLNSSLMNPQFLGVFSKFPIVTWKTLNTKVVYLVKLYNFCFGQKFIRAKVWELTFWFI